MKKYIIPEFLSKYNNGKGFNSPEPWLEEYVVNKLSSNVTTIVDFGCAHGRNFLSFPKEKYQYVGFDMHDFSNISWVQQINVKYHNCSLEDFFLYWKKYDIDWENSLVMTHGTLMYLPSAEQQNNFINLLTQLRCKNFVFHEYGSEKVLPNLSEPARNGGLGWLSLNENNKKLFEVFRFRDFENDLCAFINLKN